MVTCPVLESTYRAPADPCVLTEMVGPSERGLSSDNDRPFSHTSIDARDASMRTSPEVAAVLPESGLTTFPIRSKRIPRKEVSKCSACGRGRLIQNPAAKTTDAAATAQPAFH